jgi:hypothetical protein
MHTTKKNAKIGKNRKKLTRSDLVKFSPNFSLISRRVFKPFRQITKR